MGMVTDRTGALVKVPTVRRVDALKDGDKGLLVITVDGDLGLPATGVVPYASHEGAAIAAEEVRRDIEAGRDPAVLVAMVQAGPAPFPWRLLWWAVGLCAALVAIHMAIGGPA